MTFAIVHSVLLGVSFVLLLATAVGRMIPFGVRLLPLVAATALWLHTIYFRLQERDGIGAGFLIGFFYLIAYVMVFLPAIGGVVIAILDRPREVAVETMGAEGGGEQVLLVYHPGVTGFTGEVIKELGRQLEKKGYHVTLRGADPGRKLELESISAVGFASPVYAGTIRPPLARVIRRSDLKDKNTFVVLTGTDPDNAERDTEKAAEKVTEKGGRVAGKIKLIATEDWKQVRNQIGMFADALADAL